MAEEKKGTDTMKELRDWLVTKCRLPGFSTSFDRGDNSRGNGRSGSCDRGGHSGGMVNCQQQQFTANVVTPRTIPQFVIPGSNDSSRQPSIGSNDDLHSHSSGDPSVNSWSASTSPGVSPRSSFSALAAPENTLVRIRSAPVSPRRDSHGFLRDFGIRSMSNLPHVQVDQAAPTTNGHHTTKSFRSNSGGTLATLGAPVIPSVSQRKGSLTIPGSESRPRHSRRMHRSSQDFYSEDRNVSSDLLHVNHLTAEYRGTYSGLTDKNEYLPMKESFRRSKRYYRRRSSLVTSDVMRLLYHQHSADSTNSPNGSPYHSRGRKQLAPIDPLQDKRHSSPEVSVTEAKQSSEEKHSGLEKAKSNSLANLASHAAATQTEPCAKTVTERGDIKFSFQYFPATKRLKVIIIRAEGLRFPEKPDLVLNPFMKICLMPGKLQKQSSEPAKQTCAPMLNKEFFFTDLNLEEMKNLRLRIMAFHKAHHLKLPEYLGEVNVPLSNYDLLMENRMWNDLHFKPYKKDLGHLQVELLLDSRLARLLVGVSQARGLPSHHLTGAPEYPRLTAVMLYTHQLWWTKLGTVAAARLLNNLDCVNSDTYRGPFMMGYGGSFTEITINTRSKALSLTRIVFEVHDRDRLRGDPLIGHVMMGQGSTEESVMEHWDEAMVGNGRKICRWHYIMEKGETHDV
ncbi:C2 calcium-dependent domain-containing protein 4C [Aplysia californica]|uniref:C2 calcium-dependent domain-containing protein 4C n=1 Tax=Aplysia californica TaxID=6500 RepID=A0ABM0JIG7_APLCA|nr:C2 calcium-dependent domain-containing protein 4C [Aplysia californica]